MNKKIAVVLSLAIVFILACSLFATPPATQLSALPTYTSLPTYTPFPTYTSLPTYTPFPTYTVVPPPADSGGASALPTATAVVSNSVRYNATQIRPGISSFGNTKSSSIMYYFEGKQGQIISLVLVGDPRYQEFSLRDSDNNGLIGCDVKSQAICSITDYKLPYTGIYYVLVDRTFVDNYKQLQSCVNNPPFADWCYRGGPYSLDLIMR